MLTISAANHKMGVMNLKIWFTASVRCNLYKGDFGIEISDDLQLWNPRREFFENHFWQTDGGRLLAFTQTGELSFSILNLNRP